MNHVENKPGYTVAVCFNGVWRLKSRRSGSLEPPGGGEEHLLGMDAATCRVPTDLHVCLLVSWHLSEAERRDVAPQAKSLGDASPRVAGIDQVGGEGEQPAQKRQRRVIITRLYTHSSTARGMCQSTMATVQTRTPTSSASTAPLLILSYLGQAWTDMDTLDSNQIGIRWSVNMKQMKLLFYSCRLSFGLEWKKF